jgi:uncharacterized protein (TIGR02265 family)
MTQRSPAAASHSQALEAEYAKRIALATPTDTARGLFFNGVLSAVITFGGEPALKQCHARLNDKRFERRFIDFSSYPVSDFLRLALAASQILMPQFGSPETTQRRLGMQATRDFLSSMAGRTVLLLSGDSPKRLLDKIPNAYRSAVSYGERTVTMMGDKAARVVFTRDFMLPHYNEGVLSAVLESVNARNPRVFSRTVGTMDSEYELAWD